MDRGGGGGGGGPFYTGGGPFSTGENGPGGLFSTGENGPGVHFQRGSIFNLTPDLANAGPVSYWWCPLALLLHHCRLL